MTSVGGAQCGNEPSSLAAVIPAPADMDTVESFWPGGQPMQNRGRRVADHRTGRELWRGSGYQQPMPVLCVPGVDRLALLGSAVGAPTNSYEIATTTQPGKIVIVQAASPQLRGEGYVRHARTVQLELDGKFPGSRCG